MGKTRDFFKKIRDTKGTFHAKMGSIKDRNGRDLTEADDIKKRWQEYTEELYRKRNAKIQNGSLRRSYKYVKRREAKGKGEKERYTDLNAEFQRIARRDKNAFFSDQCKEIEENNRMGKTRDLVKKIRHIKGTFHAKMGSIKDRNGMDLTEAEDIKRRWQEYTEELYKKDLHNPDNHDGVITHLEPDILECEVKWAFTTKKASLRTKLVEVMDFQWSYFKS